MLAPSDGTRKWVARPEGGWLVHSELELEAQLVAEQTRVPDAVDYAAPPPGYTLVHARYNADLELFGAPMQLGLTIRNLLNTEYRDYLSRFRYFTADPGRTVVLRLQVPIGSAHH